MTTSCDLLLVVMDSAATTPVESGDLSLALAGAELIDLAAEDCVRLADNRVLPGSRRTGPDGLLDGAVSSMVREAPFETVDEWLWRRGRGLSWRYVDALEADGLLIRPHRHRLLFRGEGRTPADSPVRRAAMERWESGEAVLVRLAHSLGVERERSARPAAPVGDTVHVVVAAVDRALAELADERDKREHRLEDAAADNRQRGY
ncbi:GOLPH3/VPS74 family protein [Streptomyces sp. NBC_00370]|uniref:GOLPH3/VPS74 family protein n=1 Tax=Streptomyces sp. NBC_00370 TaxID=2975728 RepID=UPI002E25D8FE